MGWREETETKNLIRFTHSPPIKPTSLHDVSEDLANHFEYFLHNPKELNAKSKLASDYIQRMMGKDFKLEKEMRAYLLAFFFIISCSISHPEKPSEIAVMQRIWDLKDPSPAYAQLPQLKKIEEDKKYYVLGISKENSISRLSITYDKQTKRCRLLFGSLKNPKELLIILKLKYKLLTGRPSNIRLKIIL